MFSQCRQINGCDNKVEEAVVGTLGESNCRNAIKLHQGNAWRYRGPEPNPYQQEHQDLIASIRAGKPLNEAQAIAESTMTGIIGREAVYSGKAVEWDKAMAWTKRLGPDQVCDGPLSDARGGHAGHVSAVLRDKPATNEAKIEKVRPALEFIYP